MPEVLAGELVCTIFDRRFGAVLAAQPSCGSIWYEVLHSDGGSRFYPECNLGFSGKVLLKECRPVWKLCSLLKDAENDSAKALYEGGVYPYQFASK